MYVVFKLTQRVELRQLRNYVHRWVTIEILREIAPSMPTVYSLKHLFQTPTSVSRGALRETTLTAHVFVSFSLPASNISRSWHHFPQTCPIPLFIHATPPPRLSTFSLRIFTFIVNSILIFCHLILVSATLLFYRFGYIIHYYTIFICKFDPFSQVLAITYLHFAILITTYSRNPFQLPSRFCYAIFISTYFPLRNWGPHANWGQPDPFPPHIHSNTLRHLYPIPTREILHSYHLILLDILTFKKRKTRRN